jgi:hypothetical protein
VLVRKSALRPFHVRLSAYNDRRFAAVLGWERQPILDAVARMAAHPGANIPPAEYETIQASLTMPQCTRCHTEAVLSRLLLQTPAQ